MSLLWLNFSEVQIFLTDSQETIELVTCDSRHNTQTKPIIPQLVAEVTKEEREFLFGSRVKGRLKYS